MTLVPFSRVDCGHASAVKSSPFLDLSAKSSESASAGEVFRSNRACSGEVAGKTWAATTQARQTNKAHPIMLGEVKKDHKERNGNTEAEVELEINGRLLNHK